MTERRGGGRREVTAGEPTDSDTSSVSLTQLACDRIRDAIVHGPLDLGEPLSENALARALGMSKAPVRAALHELRAKGLVQVVPHSGTYVFSPTAGEIEDLCDFRALLEVQALKSAMLHSGPALLAELDRVVEAMRGADASVRDDGKRLDSEFHQLLIGHCGNQYLVDAYATIGYRVEALRYRFMDTTVFRQKAFAEHGEIVELLRAGRIARAVAVLEEHIARTRQFQSTTTWSLGRSRRRDYRFREHTGVFGQA